MVGDDDDVESHDDESHDDESHTRPFQVRSRNRRLQRNGKWVEKASGQLSDDRPDRLKALNGY